MDCKNVESSADHTLWGLNSSFSSYRKVLACSINQFVIVNRSRSYLHFSLFGSPISKVEIVGVVVAINIRESRQTTFIDDGTGVLRCLKVFFADEDISCCESFCIGDTICVRGVLVACESNTDSYGPIISVKRYDIVKSSNEEILHWISSMLLSEVDVETSATLRERSHAQL